MKEEYQVTDRRDRRAWARFLSGEGQALLPMLELIEQAEMAVDELIDLPGRATIEAVLTLSAQELATMLETPHPSAAGSLREGLAETFTVNRLGLPGGSGPPHRGHGCIQVPGRRGTVRR